MYIHIYTHTHTRSVNILQHSTAYTCGELQFLSVHSRTLTLTHILLQTHSHTDTVAHVLSDATPRCCLPDRKCSCHNFGTSNHQSRHAVCPEKRKNYYFAKWVSTSCARTHTQPKFYTSWDETVSETDTHTQTHTHANTHARKYTHAYIHTRIHDYQQWQWCIDAHGVSTY